MARLFYAIALGLAGAGIIHIAALLLVPHYATNDAWNRISALEPDYAFRIVEPAGAEASGIIEVHDPEFAIAACRFDLADGPVHITAPGGADFWSVSVFNSRGQNTYSFNDRNAASGALDLAIATPVQMIELRKNLPDSFADAVFVEADIDRGMAVLRVFQPDAASATTVQRMLEKADCEPFAL
ncbi:DUF1254 domain-containing protein [Zhengella mangrovi]|uniref:DUF1254 domain-containing protein n=1 Tax=Zhengella mangrovi TaxID=1982044 RepID=A0A2G1QSD4_9HYPH|nr:DUF1254 domain-containing protein [Zhengella mangrovi]PHP68364.1 DUF1254 domain-containing protein [Zhengella mangrovi]